MAVTGGMSFDLNLSAALEEAKKLDKHFDSMLEKSEAISKNMRAALSVGGKGGLEKYVDGLKDLQSLVGEIGSGKLAIDVDDKNVERLRDALGEVAKWTTYLADQGIELFDTKGIYATTKGLAEMSTEFSLISSKVNNLNVEYRKLLTAWGKEKEQGAAKEVLKKRGITGVDSYTDAELRKVAMQEQKKIEEELAAEIERQEIARNNLKFAKMTQDQKTEYIKKKIKEILDAEEAYANSVRREYAQLYRDLKSQQASIGAIDAQLAKGKVLSPEMEKQYNDLVDLEKETKAQMAKIEQDHLDYVSDLRVRYATRDAKEIAKILKTEVVDPQTALQKAADARTGLEMEAAKDAVQGALMTVDKDDLQTIADLNKAYIDLRANIEKLTKAQKNEQTLQPTLRNEYARILAEIDKVTEAKKRLEATEAYITGNAQAKDDYEKLKAREDDLMKRKAEIRDGNEALLTEIETKHEADRAQKRTEALLKYEKELENFRAKYGEITSFEAQDIIDDSEDAKNVRQSQKAIEDLKDARAKLSKEDANYDETLKKLNAEIKKHEEYIESVTDAEKYREKQARQQRETHQGALDYSKQAKSLNDMKEAMRALEVARNKEEVGTRNYKELDRELSRITKRYNELTKEVKSAHRGMFNFGEQIGRKIALWFSVSQIQGYIHKLMEVRGEFELQQKSLQAILQNKEEADEIWQKTVDLAVKSPFRIKDLVTYTKQLAAYRIESDKLYDTNKMLADVSAGLGVDMDRLILAYGQVRSAEYLRGTELRQFTEAGIPMLEELSKLLTETEGRAISTSDAFEMISKRMVGFAEVEEVFKRMTSEGGVFYQMQEKQSDTLKGQLSNLKDSIDLMLNEIGSGMEDTLKGSVATFKNIVDNWEYLAIAIKDVAGVLVVTSFAKFAKGLFASADAVDDFVDAGRGLVSMGARMQKSMLSLLTSIATKPWIALGVALASIVVVLGQVARAANKTKRELAEIASQGSFDASKSIAEYTRLANVVSDTSKTYEEQKKALATLQNKYGEILPEHYLQAKSIRELNGDYKAATDAIYEYIAAKTKEKQISKIEEVHGDKVNKAYADFAKVLRERISAIADTNVTIADVTPIIDKMREGFESGEITLENYNTALMELIKGHSGLNVNVWKDYRDGLAATAKDFLLNVGNMNKAIDDLSKGGVDWGSLKLSLDATTKPIYDELNAMRDAADETKKSFGELLNRLGDYGKMGAQGNPILSEEVYKDTISSLDNMFKDIGLEGAKWSEIINDPFKLNKVTVDYNVALWGDMIAKMNAKQFKYSGESEVRDNFVEMLKKEQKALGGTSFQQEVSRILIGLSDDMKVSLEGLNGLFASSEQSVEDYAKSVERTLETLRISVAEYDNDVAKGVNFSPIDPTKIDQMREQIPLVEQFLKLFEVYLDKSKKEGATDTFTPKLRVIKEMYSEYKRLSDLFDDITAKEGAMAKFGDAFKEAFGKTPEEMGFDLFSEEGVKAAYDYLISKAPDAKKKIQAELAKGEIVWDVKLQKKKDTDKQLLDDIQNMFDQYDLSLELKKLNIPPDLAKSLFGIESITLADIRKKVQGELDSAKAAGGQEDRIAQLEKDLEKINDMEDKASVERMKTYSKYLLEGMSERVKLKIEEMRKLKEIEESDEFTPEQKERIKAGVSKEARAEQQKQEWKDFQGSDMYTMMFEDLEHYGTAAIEMLYTKLSELKTSLSDLPASEVKEIVGQIEKLENIQIERNPFESLKKYKDEVKNIGFTEDELQTQLLDSQKAEEDAQKYIDIYNTVIQSLMSEDEGVFEEIDAKTLSQWNQMLRLAEEQGKTVEEILADRKETVETEQKNQGKIVENLNSYKKLSKAQRDSLELTQEWLTQVGNLFSSSKELMESLGVESDSVAMTIADTGSSMVSLIGSAIQFTLQLDLMEVAANSALGIIGWVAIALQAVATVLSAIFSAKDKALQKEIDGHLARAEKLHEKYEELSDAIDSAYDASVVRQLNKEIEKTIKLEIKAIEAAIAAEKAQKASKIDWNWVDEQEKAVKDLYGTLNEEHDNYIERWGGFGSEEARFDFIESMTQAWLDSFKETGDGLVGLEEKWDEYFDNLAMKQMALRVSKAAIDEYLDMWDKYVSAESAGGEDLTEAEAQELRLRKEALLKDLSEKYTSLAESLGITPTTEVGGLSALQKGISSLSESTGQVLEALLNSMRFYVADSNSELKNQTRILGDIYSLLNGMTDIMPAGKSGRGIKVVM